MLSSWLPCCYSFALTPSSTGPLLSLCFRRLWECQLLLLYFCNQFGFHSTLYAFWPTTRPLCPSSVFYLHLSHNFQSSAMHLSQLELVLLDCFLNLYATWTSLKAVFGVQERVSVLSLSCMALLQKIDCQKEQLQEMTWSDPASGERKWSA